MFTQPITTARQSMPAAVVSSTYVSEALAAADVHVDIDVDCDDDREAAANIQAGRRFKTALHLEPPLSRWVRDDICCIPAFQISRPTTSLKDGPVVNYENACAGTRETWRVSHYMKRLHQQSKYERTMKRLVASESRYARIQAELAGLIQRAEALNADKVCAENDQLRLFAEAYRERLRAWLVKAYMTSATPSEWRLKSAASINGNVDANCKAITIPCPFPLSISAPGPVQLPLGQCAYGLGSGSMQNMSSARISQASPSLSTSLTRPIPGAGAGSNTYTYSNINTSASSCNSIANSNSYSACASTKMETS